MLEFCFEWVVQYLFGGIVIDLDGDIVCICVYLVVMYVFDCQNIINNVYVGGWYEYIVVCILEGWCIVELIFVIVWEGEWLMILFGMDDVY